MGERPWIVFCLVAFQSPSRVMPGVPWRSSGSQRATEEFSFRFENYQMPLRAKELHHTGRISWLRAAVLGANDGILSTSSLVLGVAAAHATHSNIVVAGVAGLVAGAMSMAAGEYVSVHSQADTEEAELNLERTELQADDQGEHKELMAIYVARGLEPALAKQVAKQLMAHD